MSTPAPASQDVCAGALGDFGWWQLRSILIVSLVKIPSAWQMASILFTAPSPGEFWCARPVEYQSWDPQEWKDFIHPNSSAGRRDPCNIYNVGIEMLNTWTSEHHLPTNMSVRPCEQFEYTKGDVTFVTQWNLVCQREVLISVSQFFYLLGIVVGGVLCTLLLQRFSPRRIILSSMFVQVVTGVAASQAPQFELQVCLRFLTAAACANMFTSGYVICTDITSGRWRSITGACYEHMWSVGVITLAGLGYLLTNWTQLQLAISLPTVLILVAFRWIPDSPRWLIEKGRAEEAKRILEKGAAFNGRTTVMSDITTLPTKSKKTEIRWVELFRKSGDRWNCMALHIVAAATIVTYYGALLNVKNVGGHLYLNTAIAGLAEVAGVLIGLSLILWCRQKWAVLGGVLIVGGSACIASWALPTQDDSSREWAMLGMAMAGRVAIATSLTLLQVASSELLPPDHRQLGIFSSVTFARIFLLSAPFIGSLAMYGDCVSLSAFGAITFVGGLAALFLGRPRCKIFHSKQHQMNNLNIQNVWSTESTNKSPFSITSPEFSEQQFGKFNKCEQPV
ncbi:organic cation transporter protein-like isoform X2 [Periplaneta americana]